MANIQEQFSLWPITYGRFTILITGLVAVITIDILMSDLSLAIGNLPWSMPLFLAIIVAYSLIQYGVFVFIRNRTKNIERKYGFIRILSLALTIVQYIMIAILVYLLLMILERNSYNSMIIMVAIGISYGTTAAIFALLSFRFAKWYSNNRTFIVLLYCVVTLVMAFRIAAILPFYETLLLNIPEERRLESAIPEYNPNPILHNIYGISSGTALMLLWISTSILLRHYHNKIGKIKYYLIMAVIAASAAYSMSDFVLTPALESYFGDVEYWTFTAFQGVLTGIALGVPFWSISHALGPTSDAVRNYMLICGFAFCIFITSGSAIIDHAPYPPFGLVAVICMQISAYMLFIALYSSAVSVSEDVSLRRNIKKKFLEQARFLDSIGSAEMEQELIKKAMAINLKESDQMYENSGIETSVNEDEMKKYLEDVLQEVKDLKSKDK